MSKVWKCEEYAEIYWEGDCGKWGRIDRVYDQLENLNSYKLLLWSLQM